MPRKPRIDASGLLYHVMARGIEKTPIFKDRQDRNFFLERLGEIVIETETVLHAYSLICNHFHLLVRRGIVPLSTVMRRLLTGYAIYFNMRHDRVGHLFQNRYKAIICQEEIYYRQLVRYIHLNPVRTGEVGSFEDLASYPYSGHAYLLGNRQSGWFRADAVLINFGSTSHAARSKYQDFMVAGNDISLANHATGSSGDPTCSPQDMNESQDERILGENDFARKLLQKEDPGQEILEKNEVRELIEATCGIYDITHDDLLAGGKRPPFPEVRRVLALRLVQELRLSQSRTAKELGVSKSLISMILKNGQKRSI